MTHHVGIWWREEAEIGVTSQTKIYFTPKQVNNCFYFVSIPKNKKTGVYCVIFIVCSSCCANLASKISNAGSHLNLHEGLVNSTPE